MVDVDVACDQSIPGHPVRKLPLQMNAQILQAVAKQRCPLGRPFASPTHMKMGTKETGKSFVQQPGMAVILEPLMTLDFILTHFAAVIRPVFSGRGLRLIRIPCGVALAGSFRGL
ncbi:hypothetical protein [Roseomonas chloroacetimidivorans]|uniref:hypothetical protein n=1 Tax=Roseomonas chloroacetimidivorans TaxID=1766656 RepID=UPI003C735FBE